MEMQSGAVVVPEKIPWYNHHQHPMDEKEGFLMWLRGEFAAANAIIDALCYHMQSVGEPGEYDGVMGCIQQRRCNWNAVLHMQQYFSVADVSYALQQAGWRRQQKVVGFEGGGRKEYRRGGRGYRGGAEAHGFGGEVNGKAWSVNEKGKVYANGKVMEEEGLVEVKSEEDDNEELDEKSEVENTQGAVVQVEDKREGSSNVDAAGVLQKLPEKHNLRISSKTFVATEIFDGESMNVVDGMKLFENLFDISETSKLTSLVNDLRAAGRRGKLRGQTFVISKRPMKGHGREMIQLGVPIADAPREDEAAAGTSTDPKAEPIPALLHDVIERLLNVQAFSVKPDSCVIDIFNEGDYSQPRIWPQWVGRPVCLLFLTICEMTFGKVIAMDHPGDYRGALKLSLSPGSILVMEGSSADFCRHAISSTRNQRILVTLTKSQTNKYPSGEVHRFPSPLTHSSYWVPPLSRSPSHIHLVAGKHLGSIPTAVVPRTATGHPHLPLPNGVQPVFVPVPIAQAVAFPAPVVLPPTAAGWSTAPPRHPPPRLLAPGTGVFLPPQGSGNASNPPSSTPATENMTMEAPSLSDKALGQSNGTSTSAEVDNQSSKQECNGSIDGMRGETVIEKQEQDQNLISAKSTASV